MCRSVLTLLCGSLLALCAAAAGAQPTQAPPTQAPPTQAPPTQAPPTQAPPTQTPPAQAVAVPAVVNIPSEILPGVDASRQWRLEKLGPTHWKLIGDVEVERDDVRVFADEMEYFTDTGTLTAQGNVAFSTPSHRVAADRAEFNLRTKLGTFHNASGSATLGEPKPGLFGTQEADVYFYGTTIEKIGDKKYRITNGGFTTCIQPRPRWQLTSGTMILSLDHYALLTNPIIRVKNVPMLYLPVIYYPINKDDRSTGFLMPIYGTSSLRGHTISNAFFWAMGRSHDATFMHDWFSKTGQGYGGEYEYILSPSSLGNVRLYVLREKATETTSSDGTVGSKPGQKGFELRSNISQALPFKLKGRARVDYFSNVQVQQAYSQNIYAASLRQRYYGGNLSGTWGANTVNVSAERTQLFYSATDSMASGNLPRISFNRAERPIWRTPVYAAFNAEYAAISRQTTYDTSATDFGIKRFDMTPTLRLPFRKWPFLTANSLVNFRFTRWSKSLDENRETVEKPLNRAFFEMQTRIVGPVFNRVWNTNNGYAEKIKHTIEPSLTIRKSTNFDTYNNIVKLDGTDYSVGGTTRFVYALENRVYAKRNDANRQGAAREIFNLGIQQTYYTDARASLVDSSYVSGFTVVQTAAPSKFSPISIQGRVAPVDSVSAGVRLEYDRQIAAVKSLGVVGSYKLRQWVSTSGTWSKQRYFSTTNPKEITYENQYVTSQTSLRFLNNRIGGDFSLYYDLTKKLMLQKRFVGYYNPQCCGVSVEYQVYDFSGYGSYLGLRQDRRFNISITLAGLGTFSNFLGVFGAGGTTQ